MKAGVQFRNLNDIDIVRAAGYKLLEIPCDNMKPASGSFDGRIGLTADSEGLNKYSLEKALEKGRLLKAEYLVISTVNEKSQTHLMNLFSESIEGIRKAGIPIFIENSHSYNGFSETSRLIEFVDTLNSRALTECFGICFNTGNMNLLRLNPQTAINGLKKYIRLVHMNDNDGSRDLHQMPYTFTTGRGVLATDWYRIVGSLAKIRYTGDLVFDTWGLFERTPEMLHSALLNLLAALACEWEGQIYFEDIISQPQKKLILFGAGNMFCNYMKAWGEKYPPAFVIDNNPSVWEDKIMGIPVKGPMEILKVPEKERNVLICNIYYRQVEKQLEQMNVSSLRYMERYFIHG